MILLPTFIIFSQKEKKMNQFTKKTRRKTSGMTILGLKMKTINRSKIRQTHILRVLDKDINSSVEQEETIRLGKELLENPQTSSLTDTNQTPRGPPQIPMHKPRKFHRSTRMTQIFTGQSKLL
jgi:hypothetical protein